MTPRPLALAFACLFIVAGAATAASARSSDQGVFVPVEGGKLWYQTCGAGPKAVVLIHDGLLHSVGFDAVWPMLCKRFHVVRYDRRGFGRSRGADVLHSPVDDLRAVMRAARMDRAVLVGASAGGGLALEMALDHPQAVDRLVLVGAEVSGLKYSDAFVARAAPVVQRMKRLDFGGGLDLISQDQWIVAPGHDEARARVKKILAADLHNLLHLDRQRARPAVAPRLGVIKAPTLVLVGAFDHPDVKDHAAILARDIPGARRIVMSDAGHLIYLEQPGAFVDAVATFIDDGR